MEDKKVHGLEKSNIRMRKIISFMHSSSFATMILTISLIYPTLLPSSFAQIADNTNELLSKATNLSNTPNVENKDPHVMVSENGSVYATWLNRDDNRIVFTKSISQEDDRTNFSPPIYLNDDSGNHVFDVQMAVSGSNVYVLWDISDNVFFTRSTDGGGSFSRETALKIGESSTHRNTVLATSGRNNVYILFYSEVSDPQPILFVRSIDGGSTFLDPIILSNTAIGDTNLIPQLAESEDGNNVYVIWHDESGIFFKRSIDNGATFSNANNLFNGSCSRDLQLTTYRNNVYTACIVEGTDTSETESGLQRSQPYQILVFARSPDNGATFNNAVSLTDIEENYAEHPLIAAENNNVYVIWEEIQGSVSYSDIYFRKSGDNGVTFTYGTDITNDTEDSFIGDIAVYGSDLIVVWTSVLENPIRGSGLVEENQEVFLMRVKDNGTIFGNKVNISNDKADSREPAVAIHGNNAYVTWISGEYGSKSDILLTKINLGEPEKPISAAQG